VDARVTQSSLGFTNSAEQSNRPVFFLLCVQSRSNLTHRSNLELSKDQIVQWRRRWFYTAAGDWYSRNKEAWLLVIPLFLSLSRWILQVWTRSHRALCFRRCKTLYDSSKKIQNLVTCRYSIKYLLHDYEISHLHVQFHSIKVPWCWWHSHFPQFPLAQYLLWCVLNYAIKNCAEEREGDVRHLMDCLGGDYSGRGHCWCVPVASWAPAAASISLRRETKEKQRRTPSNHDMRDRPRAFSRRMYL